MLRSFALRVFLIAFVVRAIPVLLAINLGIGLDDMFQYDMLARSIVSGNGYRWYAEPDLKLIEPYVKFDLSKINYDPIHGVETSFRAPLYPAFLALVYFFSGLGARFFAARITQAALLALLAPLTYALARRVLNDKRVARAAAYIIAFYPMLLLYPLALATENLFFVLVLASVAALLWAGEIPETPALESATPGKHLLTPRARGLAKYLLAGVLLGLAVLTRSIIVAFLPIAALWIWFAVKDKRGAVIFFVSALLVTLPWTARNTLLHGQLTFVETSLGYNLYLGYHPQGNGSFQFGISLDLLTILDDAERNRVGTQAALEFIRNDPARAVYLDALKLSYLFGFETRAVMYFYSNDFFGPLPLPLLVLIALLFVLPFAAVATLAAIGIVFAWQGKGTVGSLPNRRALLLIALLFIAYIVPHILIMVEERFHMTLVPFLAVFAAYAWIHRADITQRVRIGTAPRAATLALLLVLLLLFNWSLEITRNAPKYALLFSPNGNTAGFTY